METFSPVFVLMAIAVGSFSGGLAIALVYFLRDNLTELTLTRQGLTAQTNNSHVVLEIAGKIERIDSDTKRSIRKATMELELLDMAKYGHAPEIVIVNEVANKPLICAAYENHHTRELKESGVDGYIDEKVSEIRNMVKLWQNDIPDLRGKSHRQVGQ